jgi:hypothetical protein
MRAAACLALLLAVSLPARAADPAPVPDGWTRADDGTYTHVQSGVVCRPASGPYTLVRLEGPSEPGILGVCIYSGGPLRIGKIRVRTFIDGVGETPLAIQNDRTLMGMAPAQGAPAGGKLVAAFRGGPGPVIDGARTAQFVLTSTVKGLMVDCISQTGEDKAERDFGSDNFLHACSPAE